MRVPSALCAGLVLAVGPVCSRCRSLMSGFAANPILTTLSCQECGKDLRLIGEDKSERYEYIPATMKVIEDVRLRYACACTVRAAEKPAQPIEKSTAGASLLAQVVVSKFCDHQPLHRQEQMFARHGVEISRQTMCGWMTSVASLAMPLYEKRKKVLFDSE